MQDVRLTPGASCIHHRWALECWECWKTEAMHYAKMYRELREAQDASQGPRRRDAGSSVQDV